MMNLLKENSADIKNLSRKVVSFHDFGADRVRFLTNISYTYDFPGCELVTAFSAGYGEWVMDITVSHMECANSTLAKNTLFACPGIDIAIVPGCPKMMYGADLAITSPLRPGDQVVVY